MKRPAQTAAEGLDLAGRLGLTRSEGPYLMSNQAEPLLRLGRWAEAERVLTVGAGRHPRRGSCGLPWRSSGRSWPPCVAGSMRRPAALRSARRVLGDTADLQFVQPIHYVGALIALGRGDSAGRAGGGRGGAGGRIRPPGGRGTPGRCCGWECETEADEATLARDRREEHPRRQPAAARRTGRPRRGHADAHPGQPWLPGADGRRAGAGGRHR